MLVLSYDRSNAVFVSPIPMLFWRITPQRRQCSDIFLTAVWAAMVCVSVYGVPDW